MTKIRTRIKTGNVVWIMPPCNEKFCKPAVNEAVKSIAYSYGDRIIATSYVQPDGIHPSWRGYKDLVRKAGL